jgi:hypothetical protein
MNATATEWTRAALEAIPAYKRPGIRCRCEAEANMPERDCSGRVVVDGNNPWVEIWYKGGWRAERVSWSLVVEVLNDPFASPIWFWAKGEPYQR